MGRLSREKEQLRLAQKHHEEAATMALQEECQSLRLQNQELLHEVGRRLLLLKLLFFLVQQRITLRQLT